MEQKSEKSAMDKLMQARRPNAFTLASEDEIRAWVDRQVAAGKMSLHAGARTMQLKRSMANVPQLSPLEIEYCQFIDKFSGHWPQTKAHRTAKP